MKKLAPLPWDIRIMNITSVVFVVAVLCLSVGAGVWWALRHPVFAIQKIAVYGDTAHNNEVTLRANVMPQLSGNFFTLDLGQAKAAFEALPWVRKANVRREFPNRLRVQLNEHQPVALWGENTETSMTAWCLKRMWTTSMPTSCRSSQAPRVSRCWFGKCTTMSSPFLAPCRSVWTNWSCHHAAAGACRPTAMRRLSWGEAHKKKWASVYRFS